MSLDFNKQFVALNVFKSLDKLKNIIYLIKLGFNNEKDEALPAKALSLVKERQVLIKSDSDQMVAENGCEEKQVVRPWIQWVWQGKSEKRQILGLDTSTL